MLKNRCKICFVPLVSCKRYKWKEKTLHQVDTIAEGGFSKCTKYVDMGTGEHYCVKKLKGDSIDELQREYETMREFDGHQNIIKVHGIVWIDQIHQNKEIKSISGFVILELWVLCEAPRVLLFGYYTIAVIY